MIAYDLLCSNGHQFEGWFEDGASFDRQRSEGLVSCPICDSISVSKIPSTFAIKGARNAPTSTTERNMNLAEVGKQIVDYVEKNFDNVGADFAEEALKIHYGVAEPRNIRGVSTPKEEETLKSEGVNFYRFPLPIKPNDSDQDPS
jgi:hypothetical protein